MRSLQWYFLSVGSPLRLGFCLCCIMLLLTFPTTVHSTKLLSSLTFPEFSSNKLFPAFRVSDCLPFRWLNSLIRPPPEEDPPTDLMNRESIDHLNFDAETYYLEGKYQKAIFVYQKILPHDLSNTTLFINLMIAENQWHSLGRSFFAEEILEYFLDIHIVVLTHVKNTPPRELWKESQKVPVRFNKCQMLYTLQIMLKVLITRLPTDDLPSFVQRLKTQMRNHPSERPEETVANLEAFFTQVHPILDESFSVWNPIKEILMLAQKVLLLDEFVVRIPKEQIEEVTNEFLRLVRLQLDTILPQVGRATVKQFIQEKEEEEREREGILFELMKRIERLEKQKKKLEDQKKKRKEMEKKKAKKEKEEKEAKELKKVIEEIEAIEVIKAIRAMDAMEPIQDGEEQEATTTTGPKTWTALSIKKIQSVFLNLFQALQSLLKKPIMFTKKSN